MKKVDDVNPLQHHLASESSFSSTAVWGGDNEAAAL